MRLHESAHWPPFLQKPATSSGVLGPHALLTEWLQLQGFSHSFRFSSSLEWLTELKEVLHSQLEFYYKTTNQDWSNEELHREESGRVQTQMQSCHALRMHDPPSTSMSNYQPGKLTWTLDSRVFIGVPWRRLNWWNQWPHDYSSSPVLILPLEVRQVSCSKLDPPITWLVFLVWPATHHSDAESFCQQNLRCGSRTWHQ